MVAAATAVLLLHMESFEQVPVVTLHLVRAVQLYVVLCYFLRPSSHSSQPPSSSLPAYTLLLSSSWFFSGGWLWPYATHMYWTWL
jgi:hypothetical protein